MSQHNTRQGFDTVTILTALIAGAANIIGGASIARGWLLDVGIRYYDGLSGSFNLPRGVFTPSERRLLFQGYSEAIDVLGWRIASLAIALCFVINAFLFYVFYQIRYRNKDLPVVSWSRFTAQILIMLLLIAASMIYIGTYIIHAVPIKSGIDGKAIGKSIILDIERQGCSRCLLYGEKRIEGVAIFTDEKTLFVAIRAGGLVRMPLDNIIVSPIQTGGQRRPRGQ